MRSALSLLALGLLLASAGCGGFHNEPLGSAVVRGRVVGADPSVARVTLRLAHSSGSSKDDDSSDDGSDGEEDSFGTSVDAQGRFELREVPASPGVLSIIASATHAALLEVDPVGGQVLDLGDITPQPGAFFAVTVVNRSGQPVPQAELDVDSSGVEHVRVDSQGRARLGPLPPSCYRVRAKADGYDAAEAERCIRIGEEAALTLTLAGDGP